jgi:flagellar biosynthesis GTPase FlhF
MARLIEALRWRLHMLRLALTVQPVRGGSSEDDDDADKDADKKGDPPPPDPKDRKDDPDDKVKPEDDWQAKARKHERAAKRERKAREEAERKLQERADADKSDQEKAIDQARKEAAEEARKEAAEERRSDRLEVQSTRLAAKGFQVGEGDDAETVKFADPDDAVVYVERAIRSGEVDEDDIFDAEGKVNSDALKDALGEILESKPHLRAGENGGRPKGSADTRKGDAATKDLEAMTPEDHAQRKYGAKK